MILSDSEILKEMQVGNIRIDNFRPSQLNGASYNVRLADELLVYETDYIDPIKGYVSTAFGTLDMKKKNPTKTIKIPEEGYVLYPGRLYLGMTVERTFTGPKLEPIFDGRSSVGRLGLFVHVTAGFGDPGFDGHWTLEITPIQPIRIYADVNIGQVYYHPLKGKCLKPYRGKYQGNSGIQASMMYKDFECSEHHERPAYMSVTLNRFVPEDEVEDNDPLETKACIEAGR